MCSRYDIPCGLLLISAVVITSRQSRVCVFVCVCVCNVCVCVCLHTQTYIYKYMYMPIRQNNQLNPHAETVMLHHVCIWLAMACPLMLYHQLVMSSRCVQKYLECTRVFCDQVLLCGGASLGGGGEQEERSWTRKEGTEEEERFFPGLSGWAPCSRKADIHIFVEGALLNHSRWSSLPWHAGTAW